jgi:cobaltochelatase CobN
MHLLAARPGTIADGQSAIDLQQTPGEIVLLSAADTELACLSEAHRRRDPQTPSLRLANLLFLSHNMSVDLYLENTLSQARLGIVR